MRRSRVAECWSSLWGRSQTSNGEHQREFLPGCFLRSNRGARMARTPQRLMKLQTSAISSYVRRLLWTSELKDKVVLVTGDAKGVGAAISRALAAEAAIPVIVDRDVEAANESFRLHPAVRPVGQRSREIYSLWRDFPP